jgi:hypothetical protein
MVGYDLFSPETTQSEFDSFRSTGSLPSDRKWERIRMTYDAFGRQWEALQKGPVRPKGMVCSDGEFVWQLALGERPWYVGWIWIKHRELSSFSLQE